MGRPGRIQFSGGSGDDDEKTLPCELSRARMYVCECARRRTVCVRVCLCECARACASPPLETASASAGDSHRRRKRARRGPFDSINRESLGTRTAAAVPPCEREPDRRLTDTHQRSSRDPWTRNRPCAKPHRLRTAE